MDLKLIKSVFNDDPEILRLIEARQQSALLKAVFKEKLLSEEEQVEWIKGDPGKTYTKEEVIALLKPHIPAPIKGDDGYTPVKGKDYLDGEDGKTPTKEELKALIKSVVPKNQETPAPIHTTKIVKEELTVTEQLVKDIIQIMHKLPEADKLELSQGIRNANSFIFNGTRYKIEELMHGGGATLKAGSNVTLTVNADGTTTISSTGGSGFSVITISGTIDDSNTTFTSVTQPTLLNINGSFYQQTGGSFTWTYNAGTITLSSPVGTGGSLYGV